MTFAKYPVTGGGGGGSGDVVGPASSTNGAIAFWNGTTGKLLQDSAILSSSLVLTSGAQSIAGVKTFSNEPSAPTIALTATSNQMSFGSGPNKITVNVPNNPAANLTYSMPNIAAVSLTGTFCMLEGANQTFTGANTTFSQTVRFDATTPLWLGALPNRIILDPGAQASPRTWLFPDLSVNPTFAALEGSQTFLGAKTFSSAVTINPASNQLVLASGVNQLTLNSGTSAAARTYTIPDAGASASFVLNTGASTLAGTRTFSGGIIVTGGTAADGGVWFASNVLRQRGGTSGWALDNTSGTPIVTSSNTGELVLGSVTNTPVSAFHTLYRSIFAGTPSVATNFNGSFKIGSNTYSATAGEQPARLAGLSGAHFGFFPQTSDTTNVFSIATNLSTDTATDFPINRFAITGAGSVQYGNAGANGTIDGTTGAAVFGVSGSSSTSLQHIFNLPSANSYSAITGTSVRTVRISSSNASGSVIISTRSTTNNTPGMQFITGTTDTNNTADMTWQVIENDNTDFLTQTNLAYGWYNGAGTAIMSATRAGQVTLGPISAIGGSTFAGAAIVGRTNGTAVSAGYVGETITATTTVTTATTTGITIATTASITNGIYLVTISGVSVYSSGSITNLEWTARLTTNSSLLPSVTDFYTNQGDSIGFGNATAVSTSQNSSSVSRTFVLQVTTAAIYYLRAAVTATGGGSIGLKGNITFLRVV